MAGVSEEDAENPFSFKSFLKRGEGGPSTEKVRISSKSSSSSRKKTTSKKTSVVKDSDVVIGAKRSSDDENPFSFTKFVERKSVKPLTSSSGDEESSLTVVNPVPSSSNTTLPPPFTNHTKSKHTKPSKSAASAKSTSPTQQTTSRKSSSNKPSKPKKEVQKELTIFDVSDGSDSDCTGNEPLFSAAPVSGIPSGDIFSTGMRGTSSSSGENSPEVSHRRGLDFDLRDNMIMGESSNHTSHLPFDDTAELKKLRADNDRLRKDLARSEDYLKTEKDKNSALRGQIKELKIKEAEDTKALEDMVQKVETNLVVTTKRAVAAENTIKKLKQEISSLQVQLSRSTPQAMQQHYEELLAGVRQKSSFASQQLINAAQMADKNIRELVTGVEALKNVSEILQFIDNVTELKGHDAKQTT